MALTVSAYLRQSQTPRSSGRLAIGRTEHPAFALISPHRYLEAPVDLHQEGGRQMTECAGYIPLLDGKEVRAIDDRDVTKSRRSTVGSDGIDEQLRGFTGAADVARDHGHDWCLSSADYRCRFERRLPAAVSPSVPQHV